MFHAASSGGGDTHMAIDTLGYAKYLEEHGVARDQAEAHAEAANQFLFPQLATKTDIAALSTDIRELRSDPTLRMLTIGAAYSGIVVALIKLT
jgi:hypothetical protein